jgi:hypothetical protein
MKSGKSSLDLSRSSSRSLKRQEIRKYDSYFQKKINKFITFDFWNLLSLEEKEKIFVFFIQKLPDTFSKKEVDSFIKENLTEKIGVYRSYKISQILK